MNKPISLFHNPIFESPVRHLCTKWDVVIDPDGAKIEIFAKTLSAPVAVSPNACCKAVFYIVSLG